MSGPHTITRRHLDRLAIVYVRQSTFIQVRDHTESTRRQYAQSQDAARLGWPASQIVTIDADLGLSGRSAAGRAGFKELVSRVCVGEVGAIFGLEISRLARSSADLQRLLDFCRISDTLIVDADGVYDLRNVNDRLVRGVKRTMSEAELHVLAGRLQALKRAAAARGGLRFPLPVGYVIDDEGQTVLDSHEEIRAAVSDLFSAFETNLGVARVSCPVPVTAVRGSGRKTRRNRPGGVRDQLSAREHQSGHNLLRGSRRDHRRRASEHRGRRQSAGGWRRGGAVLA